MTPLRDFLAELSDELRQAILDDVPRSFTREQPRKDFRTREDRRAAREAAEQRRILERSWRVLERFGDPNLRKHSRTPDPKDIRAALRIAKHRTHPDRKPGKSSRDFLRVQQAADILGAHLGVKL